MSEEILHKRITSLVTTYYKKVHASKKFMPGITPIPVAGRVYDASDLISLTDSALDFWLTEGKFTKQFEKDFSSFLGLKYISLVNSGSSANLVAFSSLTSSIFGDKAIRPGDEIITATTSFPTTVNPIIQNGCIPVFVDSDLSTRNALVNDINKAITKKTKAIMMAHTLGNPFQLREVMNLVKKYNLWLIEDCCDALGSQYDGKMVGTFGHVATFSFYPAHHITTGEGGAVATNNPLIHRSIRQFRDWGRDCWCDTGKDNTCRRRFNWKIGDLPLGYDHKYIYSQIGYNLKLTDMQSAVGVSQLKKINIFTAVRKKNFSYLYQRLKRYSEYFILPQYTKHADPNWFGFMLVVKDNAPFTRLDIVQYLESKKIATRSLFAGNLTRHPAYASKHWRKIGSLDNANKIMNDGFWIGVYPGISNEMISFMADAFDDFFRQITNSVFGNKSIDT